jgi:hypothetical protein
MIVVQDENGQTVSVTRVAPDAKFGVGVKPNTTYLRVEVALLRL